jgi:hypothetical protein
MKEIELTQGKVAIVDDEDYEYLNQWKWCAAKGNSTYYAIRTIHFKDKTKRNVKMHRCINGIAGYQIDHINHNGLDNRKSNLRVCDNKTNKYNSLKKKPGTSKYKGVSVRKDGRILAHIRVNKELIQLGRFKDEITAAKSYDSAALLYFKEFACINNYD